MSAFAIPHIRMENLMYFDVPFINGRPLDTNILRLIFGVILLAYFGHTSTANCARIVLRREPTGRALITGNIAAMATAILVYCFWIVVVNGAIEPQTLFRETGTVIGPLADKVGRSVEIFGTLYVVLGMGMASVHYSLGLFNQAREWTPSHIFRYMLSARSRYWLSAAPVIIVFVVIEGLLVTNHGTYSGTLGFLGVLKGSLLGGIFPMLMLVASRRKGEYVPGLVIRFFGNRVLVIAVYLLFLTGIFLHGWLIWQDTWQRLAAFVVGLVALGMPFVFIKNGNFKPRAVVELRAEKDTMGRGEFQVTSNGVLLPTQVCLHYPDGDQKVNAAQGVIKNFDTMTTATFQLPSDQAQELKMWVHEITEDGASEWLPAKVQVSNDSGLLFKDLIDREQVLPLNHDGCRIDVQFLPSEEQMIAHQAVAD
jgi:hypothetical protein